jgi:hypothetical protein
MPAQVDPADECVQLSLESVLLDVGDHVGVFYRGEQERDAFVLPLISAALAAECGVIYVCDREEPEQVAKQLLASSTDVDEALRRGQIRLAASAEAYLAGGSFDPDHTVGFYRHAEQSNCHNGYPVLCVIGEMSWSLRGCPGTERLLEYEARYAQEFATAPAITLCLYDLAQTRGEQIFDLLRLHSRVVLNGIEIPKPHLDPGYFLGGADVRG